VINTQQQLKNNFKKNYDQIHSILFDQIRINLNHIAIGYTYVYIDTDILFAVPKCLFYFKVCVSMAQPYFKTRVKGFYFDSDNFPDNIDINLDYYRNQHEIRKYFNIDLTCFEKVNQLLDENLKTPIRTKNTTSIQQA
jgi:hypothetical protein